MSRASADIIGSVGANFVATIDSGTITEAKIGTQDVPIGADNRSVTVANLAAGDSAIRLAVVFAPGDADANVGVGAVTSGDAKAQTPPGIIPNTLLADVINLFGE
jgi:hypothetical protein